MEGAVYQKLARCRGAGGPLQKRAGRVVCSMRPVITTKRPPPLVPNPSMPRLKLRGNHQDQARLGVAVEGSLLSGTPVVLEVSRQLSAGHCGGKVY